MLTIIRTKGSVKSTQEQLGTLACLNLKTNHSVAVLEATSTNLGMVNKVRNIVVWFSTTQKIEPGRYNPPKAGYKLKQRTGLVSEQVGLKLLYSMKRGKLQ